MVSRDEIPCSSWRSREQSCFISRSRHGLQPPGTLRSPSPQSAIGSAPYLHTETGTGTRSFAAASVFRLCINLDGDCYDSALTTGTRNRLLTFEQGLLVPTQHALFLRTCHAISHYDETSSSEWRRRWYSTCASSRSSSRTSIVRGRCQTKQNIYSYY